jgi:hypothetical protein
MSTLFNGLLPGISERTEFDRRLQRTAIEYLLTRGDEAAGMALLSSELYTEDPDGHYDYWAVNVVLSTEPAVSDSMKSVWGQAPPIVDAIGTAIEECLPHSVHFGRLHVEVRLLEAEEHWRETLMDQLRGRGVNNQGMERGKLRAPYEFEGLRYRSKAEVAIAQALEVTDAAYWPNCLARLGLDATNRKMREADFLIHRRGRWGIFEVDGVNYHGGNAAQDHARDRFFLQHGPMLIQRFPARDCLARPAEVVAEFFQLLANSKL